MHFYPICWIWYRYCILCIYKIETSAFTFLLECFLYTYMTDYYYVLLFFVHFFLFSFSFFICPCIIPLSWTIQGENKTKGLHKTRLYCILYHIFYFFLSSLIQLTQLKRQTQGYNNTLLFPKYSLSIRSVIQQFLYNLYKPHKTLIHILFSLFPTNVFLFLKTRQAFLYLAWFYSPLSLHSFCYVRAP